MDTIEPSLSEFAAANQLQRHRTVAEDAYSILHAAICTGRMSPGQRLPITEVANSLGMSPMPIREALRRLDADGLVKNIPHRGASVAELSLEDLTQIYEVRLALEPLAVLHAAANFEESDVEQADEQLGLLRAAVGRGDETAAWAAHTGFHFTLYKASKSDWLMRSITPAWESSERYRFASSAKRSFKGREAEHRRILAACAAHDGKLAAKELHEHLTKTATAVAKAMGGGPSLFREDKGADGA